MRIARTRKPQGCTEERETLESSTDIEQTQSSRSNAPTGKMKTPETRPLWNWLRVIEGKPANEAIQRRTRSEKPSRKLDRRY